MDDGNSIIRLRSNDEIVFEITRDEGSISTLIRDAMEGNTGALEIKIDQVNSTFLEKMVCFMKHYAVERMNEISTDPGALSFNEVRMAGWQVCNRI